jgi:Tlde1 domain
MTDGIEIDDDSTIHVQQRRPGRTQNLLGGVALALIAVACGWTLYTNLAGTHPDIVVAAPQVTLVATRPAASAPTVDAPPAVPRAPAAAARPAKRANAGLLIAPRMDVTLFGKATILPPTRFSTGTVAAPRPEPQVARSAMPVPLPVPRPTDLGLALPKNPTLDALARRRSDDPFEKLFGKRETGAALAYAPADGVSGDGQSKPGTRRPPNDGLTAIYDIKARTVYLPDGSRLEAHSGLGPRMDDPRYAHVRMHGVTPPHVYDLAPREALFHGVEALRMHPVGGAEAIYGRAGILTHSYLLGPNGDSNGCVSFKDYDAFLRAYKAGKVKRMVVVASIEDPQFDVRLIDRPPVKVDRTYTASVRSTFTRPDDDRYLPDISSSRAWRTNSSARSL